MPLPTTFEALAKTAVACGYILTRHEETMLIAIPWTENAVSASDLIDRLFGAGNGIINDEPDKKLHGRKVWHITLGDDLTLDVSVMPRIATERQRLAKRHRLEDRNQAIYNDYVYHNLTRGALSDKYNLSTFHLTGILDQLRQRRQRVDAKAGLIRPGLDPYKRRIKNEYGHEPGYILVYPSQNPNSLNPLVLKHSNTTPAVWTYREAQKEADRLNQLHRTPPL